MIAFHGNQEIKQTYLSRVAAHEAADEIAQGYYWENGKGCAVGCTIHGSQHALYETDLGIPEELAYLQDGIFEGLQNAKAKLFPREFLDAIPVGADLSLVVNQFLVWLLVDPLHGVIRFASKDSEREAINAVAKLHLRVISGDPPDKSEWAAARAAAGAAAGDAAWAAARDAAWDAARDAAWDAARAAARDAAWDAAGAAAWAAARDAARDAAWAAAWAAQKDKLLALLRAAPVTVHAGDK
jgi:hypothetical protein